MVLRITSALIVSAGVASANLIVGSDISPTYRIDVAADTATELFTGLSVWGMAADDAGGVLYVSSGDQLFGVDYDTLQTELLTPIANNETLVGLAFNTADGKLYGTRTSGEEGLYEVDPIDGSLSLVLNFDNAFDFGGIDYDPASGLFYGTNDATGGGSGRGLYSLNAATGEVLRVAAYPAGQTDLDGLAIGNGKAYLTPDQPGDIFVFDLASQTFDSPLTSPFVSIDSTFSGATWSSIPEPASVFGLLVTALLVRLRRA